MSRDDEFYNVGWLLFPWLASVSSSKGFVGYYRGDFDDYPTLIQFANNKASVYELEVVIPETPNLTEKINQKDVLSFKLEDLSDLVRQELLWQAEKSAVSLDIYLSQIVARRRRMDQDWT